MPTFDGEEGIVHGQMNDPESPRAERRPTLFAVLDGV
jgi:hypothetical protein